MTEHKPFRGIFPYLVSPVDADGRVRERVLRDVIRHVIAEGVQGVSPLGSTGEFAYLTFEQRCEIVRIAVDEVAGRVPVVPGVAAYSIADAQRQAEAFVKLGADGLVLILQTLFPVSPRGIERYFSTVASSVPVPSALYTNPGLLGGDIPHDVIEALSHVPNIRYIKDASGNTGRILSILNRVGGRIEVFSASAHIPLVVFQIGGVGWMAGPACVIPRQSVELYQLATAGRWDEAFALQKKLWAINELFQKYALAGCIKAALTVQGFDVGDPIAPQEPLRPEAVAEIKRVLDGLNG